MRGVCRRPTCQGPCGFELGHIPRRGDRDGLTHSLYAFRPLTNVVVVTIDDRSPSPNGRGSMRIREVRPPSFKHWMFVW